MRARLHRKFYTICDSSMSQLRHRPSLYDNARPLPQSMRHNQMMPRTPAPSATTFGFLLIDEYSMMAFTAAIDQIRMANRLSGKSLYRWVVLGESAASVRASCGLTLEVGALADAPPLDALFVCGGVNIERKNSETLCGALRAVGDGGVSLGAICTGSLLLAEAGLLDGYRCTIHWENISGLRERFPELIISSELFELDRDRYTCAGGAAVVDMMVHLIARQHGWELANEVAEEFLVERVRGRNDRQRLPLRLRLGTAQPKLADAVAFMEANIEERISLGEITAHVGVSRRQLERLFQKHLHCVPSKYYLRLRLDHARRLLLQTTLPIAKVAGASGFVSTPRFSKCYRDHFGVPPNQERRARQLA